LSLHDALPIFLDEVRAVVGAPFDEVADDLRTGGGLLSRGRGGRGRGARAGEQSGAEYGGTGGGQQRPQGAGAVGGWHPVSPRGGGEPGSFGMNAVTRWEPKH